MFTRVSVWLDNDNQNEVAFRQALEWASLLRLPLEGICTGAISPVQTISRQSRNDWFDRAAAQRQVEWNRVFFRGDRAENLQQFTKPDVLWVCPHEVGRAGGNHKLPHFMLDCLQSSMLYASPNHHELQRILIVDHEIEFRAAFFDSAARLCARLGVEPVILTVGADEKTVQRRRESLGAVVGKHLHRAEFDLVFGSDLRGAVHLVTGCRGCSHVVVENTGPAQRNCWWRRDPVDDLRRRLGELGMLVLPRPSCESSGRRFAESWSAPDHAELENQNIRL